jgi:hypothetical protein
MELEGDVNAGIIRKVAEGGLGGCGNFSAVTHEDFLVSGRPRDV